MQKAIEHQLLQWDGRARAQTRPRPTPHTHTRSATPAPREGRRAARRAAIASPLEPEQQFGAEVAVIALRGYLWEIGRGISEGLGNRQRESYVERER